jgi:hypothetical protein
MPEHRARLETTARATTTLGDLDRATPWLWLYCEKCPHHAQLACAVPVMRWGADTSGGKLRLGGSGSMSGRHFSLFLDKYE